MCKFLVKTRFDFAFVTEPNFSSKAKFTNYHLMSCVTLGVQTHLVRPLSGAFLHPDLMAQRVLRVHQISANRVGGTALKWLKHHNVLWNMPHRGHCAW